MTINDFIKAIRKHQEANEIRFYSDGGYSYTVVDETGKKIFPHELSIILELDVHGGNYVKVDGNVCLQTATITRSEDIGVSGHVRKVMYCSDSNTCIVTGDIP